MLSFKKKAAIKVFYYLMSVDGSVTDDELESFGDIGNELDSENFKEYRDDAVEECEKQLKSGIDEDDLYELVLEGIDKELTCKADKGEEGISVRLLIWDMLVIAFSNNDYSSAERKVIKHIVRTSDMEHSVFLEMEQIMMTNAAVDKELAWIEKSDRPYAEIRPIAEELEKRRKSVIESAKRLIEDETYVSVEKMELPKNDLLENVVKIGDNIVSGTAEFGKIAAETTSNVASNIGKQAQKLFSGINPFGRK